MDVEKTIQFLLSNQAAFDARQAAADARLTRIEAITASNAEDIKGLAGHLREFAQRSFEADQRLGERIDELDQKLGKRIDKLGERIDKLVSGIGEFMRRDIPPDIQ